MAGQVGPLAHLVEHLPFKQVVPGSNPGRLSSLSDKRVHKGDTMKKRYFVIGVIVSALVSLALITGCGTNPTGGGGGGGGGLPVKYANYIWVSNTGSDDAGTGTSEACAYQTINHALSVATPETLIRVVDGLYTEHLIWPTTKTVCISGESRDGTIISSDATVRCIDIGPGSATNQTITMESLTITNGCPPSGLGNNGGGIFIDQSDINLSLKNVAMTYNRVDTTVDDRGGAIYGEYNTDSVIAENCIFSSNEAYSGGAIFLQAAGASDTNILKAKNCIFFGNSARYQAGAVFAPYVLLEASAFYDNSATYPGGSDYSNSGAAYIMDGGLIVNCVFYNNTVTGSGSIQVNGGAIRFDDNAILEVVNCTIVSNEVIGSTAGYGGGISYASAANPLLKVKNCIVWGNMAASSPEVASYSTYPTVGPTCKVSYSDIKGGYAGKGNVNINPIFVGTIPYSSVEAFKLSSSSTTKVTHGGTMSGAPSRDYSGKARGVPSIVGSIQFYSMGAFEY